MKRMKSYQTGNNEQYPKSLLFTMAERNLCNINPDLFFHKGAKGTKVTPGVASCDDRGNNKQCRNNRSDKSNVHDGRTKQMKK
jgi:hypothetical protein